MAKKPETVFQDRIRPQLEALPNTWLVKIQQKAIRGIPDFLLCINSFFFALELKASVKEKPNPLQRYTLDRIITRGRGVALVVCPENWSEVYEYLQHIARGEPDGGQSQARPISFARFHSRAR